VSPSTDERPKVDSISVRLKISEINAGLPVIHGGLSYINGETMRITQFTNEQAIDVWMRHFSGQYQHEIAAAYVINVRAVNHVLKEKTHVGTKQIAELRFSKSA